MGLCGSKDAAPDAVVPQPAAAEAAPASDTAAGPAAGSGDAAAPAEAEAEAPAVEAEGDAAEEEGADTDESWLKKMKKRKKKEEKHGVKGMNKWDKKDRAAETSCQTVNVGDDKPAAVAAYVALLGKDDENAQVFKHVTQALIFIDRDTDEDKAAWLKAFEDAGGIELLASGIEWTNSACGTYLIYFPL